MNSPILIVTALYSFIGLCLNGAILYLLLAHGRRSYHYVFAVVPFACAVWDLGILLEMVRNAHVNELALYGQIISFPAFFIGPAMFHFTHLYTHRASRWVVALFWAVSVICLARIVLGLSVMVDGTLSYSWGNLHKAASISLIDAVFFAVWYAGMFVSVWLLYGYRAQSTVRLARRHTAYIMVGFLAIAVATVKILLTMGVDVPFLLPLGMALTDVFAAVIGVAILKDRLLDITVIVKKTAIYSALAAVVVVVFSLCEHLLAAYVAEFIGEGSQLLHLISIVVVIALAMPLKGQLERFMDRVFAKRMVEV